MSPAVKLAEASLYVGKTTHARQGPRAHRFSYGIFQLLIDIDRLADATRGLRLFRHGRFGLFSFDEHDHGARDGSPLRPWVEARLAEAGLSASAHRIRLLSFPRMLGFVFNPISIFFVEDDCGRLEAVIYEVNNTFGQTHAYVAPAEGRACERQEAEKRLYVSPFYGVDGAYRFLITPPAKTFNLVITKFVEGAVDFHRDPERRAARADRRGFAQTPPRHALDDPGRGRRHPLAGVQTLAERRALRRPTQGPASRYERRSCILSHFVTF